MLYVILIYVILICMLYYTGMENPVTYDLLMSFVQCFIHLMSMDRPNDLYFIKYPDLCSAGSIGDLAQIIIRTSVKLLSVSIRNSFKYITQFKSI